MDVYIKRDYVMQVLTYVGTAEPTDIIPLTLAAARKAIMRLPTAELEQLAVIERLKAENEKLTINMNAYGLTAKRLKEDVDRLQDINNRDVENLRLAKAEVALSLIEHLETEGLLNMTPQGIANLKKKYTGEKT